MLVNGENIEFEANHPLIQLLEKLQLHEKKGLAVAVNNKVIPKSNWSVHLLDSNDKVTIIRATQGG